MDSVFRRCTLFPDFIWILLPFELYPLLLLVPIAFSQSKQIATLPKIKIRSPSPHDCCSRASSAALLVSRITLDYFHFISYACACCHVFYSTLCSRRSVPITTNIDILAQAAQFVGASRSINTSHTLFLSCVQCGARLQLSRDALCMHSIVHVFSSGGGAQELRELHIAGLRPDLLMCTRMHMNRFSHRTLSRRFFKCHIPLLSWKHALVSSKWFLKQAYCPTAIDPSCAHIYAHARVNKFDPGERTKFNLLHPQENAPKACAQSSDAGPSEPPPNPARPALMDSTVDFTPFMYTRCKSFSFLSSCATRKVTARSLC